MKQEDFSIVVLGLGYVGLPLAIEFGKLRPVIGVDTDTKRIAELAEGFDRTKEASRDELLAASGLKFCKGLDQMGLSPSANVIYIITVPTPIDKIKRPDLSALYSATEAVGRVLRSGDFVVYESTVFPGCTEEECVPILERVSSLRYNIDFFCGYSPERINPGDKDRTLTKIQKITSGSTPEAASLIDDLYSSIISAGTYKAESIAVAEAAKVIENTQRDLNIALINELALIFNKLEIDTQAVLEAAGTKWNFLPFKPGLVGGHCIGVDPYYITAKAQSIGYEPEVILAGRRLNDSMSRYIAQRLVKCMLSRSMEVTTASILILGVTFKENCPDIRNSKVFDLIDELRQYKLNVEAHDPWVSAINSDLDSDVVLAKEPQIGKYDVVVLAVPHALFLGDGFSFIKSLLAPQSFVFDIKSALPREFGAVRL